MPNTVLANADALPKSADRPLTLEDFAVQEFSAWTAEELRAVEPPPAEQLHVHLFILGVAHAMLGKSKGEMIKMIRQFDESPSTSGQGVYDRLVSAMEFFEVCAAMMSAAQGRYLSAAASVAIEGRAA